MGEIGETLRERRMTLKVDVHEVEVSTKIRSKYLRALENEEYDLLPGEAYVKSFLRTYADYLGLDSRALLAAYKLEHQQQEEEHALFGARRDPAPNSRRKWIAAIVVVVVILLLLFVVGVIGGGGSGGS